MVWIHVVELLQFHLRINGIGDYKDKVLGLGNQLSIHLPFHSKDIDSDDCVCYDVNKGHYVKMVLKGRWRTREVMYLS